MGDVLNEEAISGLKKELKEIESEQKEIGKKLDEFRGTVYKLEERNNELWRRKKKIEDLLEEYADGNR